MLHFKCLLNFVTSYSLDPLPFSNHAGYMSGLLSNEQFIQLDFSPWYFLILSR